ncbi:acyl carrier protein [Methylomonas sp. SURF-1]|uniref:Acyl carrier protein n=1 Tax=Methylomonas aurea TaxID=2952224 RepID=A0ABT1UHQ3_9GAMM|nr:acyl carrier protein [Methylomonas sp. SURF-1]MCQ8181762.1 acyl carrier protein [Methylomonas sp. SURF-1]
MKNREQILATIQDIMVEMFEMDPARIEPEARLYEDLDFDSIDAVDMIVRLKELTGKMVKPEDFKTARTIGDVVEAVHRLMQD